LLLSLIAAAGCSADDDRPNTSAVDGSLDRTTDTGSVAEAGKGDAGNERSPIDVGGGSDDRAADSGADTSTSDSTIDRNVADASTDPPSDAPFGRPSDGAMDGNDGSAEGGGEAGGTDGAVDRRVDVTPDRNGDAPGDVNSDRGDGGIRKPSGVFGGGPFYHNADTVMPTMRASGFSTMILWSIHVHMNGDFVLNDVPIFSNGNYVGSDAAWPSKVAGLKTAPTSVTRVEFSVGSAGVADFETIESLISSQGTGPSSVLYRNFSALKAAIPIVDAINYDDESNYDVASTVSLSIMLGDLGYKVTLCPYTNSSFWTAVFNQTNAQRPGLVDRILLQVYAGGASNNPVTWSGYFGGLQVEAGLWSRHGTNCATGDTPSSVRTKMTNWRSGVGGGWMWLLDDMLACDSQYPLEDYAAAINEALNP
jgi:hypothetical protein